MSKEACVEVMGTVVEKFPSGLFSDQLDQERSVPAHLAEISPFEFLLRADLTKGRIAYRHK